MEAASAGSVFYELDALHDAVALWQIQHFDMGTADLWVWPRAKPQRCTEAKKGLAWNSRR